MAARRSSLPRDSVSAWVPYLLGAVTGLALMAGLQELRSSREPDVVFYRTVRDLVTGSFVREIDREALIDDALRGMVGSLDPYSRFYEAAEIGALDRETTGTFTGIGVVFKPPSSERRVLFPVPGSPAAGKIDVGDRILTLDGVELSGLDPGDLQGRMSEKSGREVVLGLESREGERREEVLVPAKVVDPTVRHGTMLDSELGVAYLAVLAFSSETPREFDAEIGYLRAQGMRSLVVDLRGNPGGVLQAAVALANRFIPEGKLVVTRSRTEARLYSADPELAQWAGTPLVLLVDGESASASEVFAAAIQDHRVGAIVGIPTYGKGMVQTLESYGKRAVVKLTTALYYTPADRLIDRSHSSQCAAGIDPDLYMPVERGVTARIHGHLSTYSPPHALLAKIERWESEEGLRLVAEWPEDPQREAAVALLAGRLDLARGG